MENSFGKLFTITSFGESHGRCIGIVVDGCPAGLPIGEEDIQREVDKRKPTSPIATTRVEEEKVELLSGIFNGHTTGAPISLLIWNKDIDSSEYEKTRHLLRPGHADYTAFMKYGGFNDFRGGGRFSGRITATFVMAGAIAKKLLNVIYDSTTEVATAVITALLTTIVSFLPVFAMQAAEGKLFKPLAFTKTFAMISALIIGLVIIPALAHVIFSIRFDKRRIVRIWSLILVAAGIFFIAFSALTRNFTKSK